MSKSRHSRHDKNAVMLRAIARGSLCYVHATAFGYTISESRPPHGMSYYKVEGIQVELANYEPREGYTFAKMEVKR